MGKSQLYIQQANSHKIEVILPFKFTLYSGENNIVLCMLKWFEAWYTWREPFQNELQLINNDINDARSTVDIDTNLDKFNDIIHGVC